MWVHDTIHWRQKYGEYHQLSQEKKKSNGDLTAALREKTQHRHLFSEQTPAAADAEAQEKLLCGHG